MAEEILYKGIPVMEPDPSPLAGGGGIVNRAHKAIANRLEALDNVAFDLPIADLYKRYGAKANGVDDDSIALADAIEDKINTGANIYLRPDRKWAFGVQRDIKSYYPFIISSDMYTHPFGVDEVQANSAFVRPLASMTHMIRWVRPDSDIGESSPQFRPGGGGVRGLNFADWDGDSNRNFDIGWLLYPEDATYFLVDHTRFTFIKGGCIRAGHVITCELNWVHQMQCGDLRATVPYYPLYIAGINDAAHENGFSAVHAHRYWSETSFLAHHVKINLGGGFECDRFYGENNDAHTPSMRFIDCDGSLDLRDLECNNSSADRMISMNGGNDTLWNTINGGSFNGTSPIYVWSNARDAQLIGGIKFIGNGQTGSAVVMTGQGSKCNGNKFYAGGNIDLSAAPYGQVLDNYLELCSSTESHLIKGGDGGRVEGNTIVGPQVTVAPAHGILGGGGSFGTTIKHNNIFGLRDKTGIKQTAAHDEVRDNKVMAFNNGMAVDWFDGGIGGNNFGDAVAVTAALPEVWNSTATAHKPKVRITTSEDIATAPGGAHVITLTNKLVNTGSTFRVSFMRGTTSVTEFRLVEAWGQLGVVYITFKNDGAGNLNGSVICDVEVING